MALLMPPELLKRSFAVHRGEDPKNVFKLLAREYKVDEWMLIHWATKLGLVRFGHESYP